MRFPDVDRAEAFYGRSLGLTRLFRFGELVFVDCAGVRLMLERSSGTVRATNGTCHYFEVDDIDASVSELASRGVEFVNTPHLIARMPDHELWMTFFRDADGYMLALMEERR